MRELGLTVITIAYAVPDPKRSDKLKRYMLCDQSGAWKPTICLAKYDAIDNVSTCVSPGVPCVLKACECATIERSIGIGNICYQCLRNGEVGLRQANQYHRRVINSSHGDTDTHSTVLKVYVVCLKIDVPEEWLERGTSRPSANQGSIE